MKRIKYALIAIISALTVLTAINPTPAYAESGEQNCDDASFLTFPAWYRGLPRTDDCGVGIVEGDDAISRTIWVIALNVVEIIIQLVGYVSIAYIIIGGWKYILSNGSADGNVKGRKTILNAVIGLIIALASVAIVNTLVNALM